MTLKQIFRKFRFMQTAPAFFLFLLCACSPELARQGAIPIKEKGTQFIPTGVYITPTAAKNSTFQALNPGLAAFPGFEAGQAVTTAVSPDGNTLLVLTSGYNLQNNADGSLGQSSEFIFIFDICDLKAVQSQTIQIPNSFDGLAWNPNGLEFYASGGNNDNVHVFAKNSGVWAEAGAPIPLGHRHANGLNVGPEAAGLAVSAGGKLLIISNYENDSISLVDLSNRVKLGSDLDLRPGNGVPGGTYPFWVSIKGDKKAYVSSQRDREIDVIDISNASAPTVIKRIPVQGIPNKMIMNKGQNLLYVALGNSDSVAIIDTGSDLVVSRFKTLAPKESVHNKENFNGINPNGLAFSPDERTLYVTNGGANSLAVIRLNKNGIVDDPGDAVKGLIPTGWYPNSVSLNRSGTTIYVVNGKSNAGPNPGGCRNTPSPDSAALAACRSENQYVWQLTRAGFQTIPAPDHDELKRLTGQVVRNNHYEVLGVPGTAGNMAFLRSRIKHIIYIIKENRTYDQVLGDLDVGNGDPLLTLFPEVIAPNQHKLARDFVDLDSFYDSAETSGDGWNWSTAARTSDTLEKTNPLVCATRGLSYDYEGTNRNINVGYATLAQRRAANPLTPDDPDILPGTSDVSAPDDSEGDAGMGYLWDASLQAGLTVRNYGCFIDLTRYFLPPAYAAAAIPPLIDPYRSGTIVSYPAKAVLQGITDPYFRGFDNNFPDFYRELEWEREFEQYEENGNLPTLEMVRLMHDHMGNFGTAISGVNTPETQVADNDYAVGRIIDKVSHSSQYSGNTLVFVVEDDAQDGPDHVDAHRSIAFVAGPFVKHGTVISTKYTTVNMVRTIGEILGIKPLGINDASAGPMDDLFSPEFRSWSFDAVVPDVLRTSTTLPMPSAAAENMRQPRRSTFTAARTPRHDAGYWEKKTAGFDFTAEDKIDALGFNKVLWEGLKGKDMQYPTVRDGRDLSQERQEILRKLANGGLREDSSSNYE